MQLVITGKIKPYTRMTQRGKFVEPQAQAYLASQERIRLQMINQVWDYERPIIKRGVPIRFHAVIMGYGHNCDVSNLMKALEDAAQGILFHNDCWVDDLHGVRSDFKAEPKIILLVEKI